MVTLILLLVFAGFYLFYQTSDRIITKRINRLDHWIYSHKAHAKSLGFVAFLLALVYAIFAFGVGAGCFMFLMLLVTCSCFIILIAPLNLLSYKPLIIVGFLLLALERFLL